MREEWAAGDISANTPVHPQLSQDGRRSLIKEDLEEQERAGAWV